MQKNNLKTYGILAYPAEHSLSPTLHNAAFQKLGLSAIYKKFSIPPTDLKSFITQARTNIAGLSVSTPHKQSIIPFLDKFSPLAASIGAVNTVLNDHGTLIGHNTDAAGFYHTIQQKKLTQPILLLGAGGTAKAITHQLNFTSHPVLIAANRTEIKLNTLKLPKQTITTSLEKLPNFSSLIKKHRPLLINATSIWLNSPHASLTKLIIPELVSYCSAVFDLSYQPLHTPLIKKAKQQNIPFFTGDLMLLNQAVSQFEYWTHNKAPISTMKQKLNKQLLLQKI